MHKLHSKHGAIAICTVGVQKQHIAYDAATSFPSLVTVKSHAIGLTTGYTKRKLLYGSSEDGESVWQVLSSWPFKGSSWLKLTCRGNISRLARCLGWYYTRHFTPARSVIKHYSDSAFDLRMQTCLLQPGSTSCKIALHVYEIVAIDWCLLLSF